MALRRRRAQMAGDSDFGPLIDYVAQLKVNLNLKGHQNRMIGLKVMAFC